MAIVNVSVEALFDKNLRPVEIVRPADAIRLKYLFSDWKINNALFDKFVSVPWLNVIDSARLNRLYFGWHSGYKRPSPYLHNFIQEWVGNYPPYSVSQEDALSIADDLEAMYGESWTKLWEMYMKRIDPMNNFHWEEITTGRDVTSEDGSVTTHFGQTISDSSSKDSTDTRTGNVTDNTNFVGQSTNTKQSSGTEKIKHDNERELTTGVKETDSDENTRTGSVGETGATARYGFDSIATGEGSPYDRRAGNTQYNNLKDTSEKTRLSTTTETGTDGYEETHSFDNRQDTETTSFDGRADNSTLTYNNVTDTSSVSTSGSKNYGGSDRSTKSGSTDKSVNRSVEVSGYRDIEYLEQLRKAFKAYETAFFDKVFSDIDRVIALSLY